jgi:hypothetical protein
MTNDDIADIAEIIPAVLAEIGEGALDDLDDESRGTAIAIARDVLTLCCNLGIRVKDSDGIGWRRELWGILACGLLQEFIECDTRGRRNLPVALPRSSTP